MTKELKMPNGTITDEDVKFVETWENIAAHGNVVKRLDARGDEADEVITGQVRFMLTTQERIITEGKVLDPKNNPFRNGDFRPIVIPDSLTIEDNPNSVSDDEILRIFGASDVAYEEWISSVDSLATLRRMITIAETQDDFTMKRFRRLEERLVEVRGESRVRLTSSDPELSNFLDGRPQHKRGTTDDSAASNPRRRQGGRSSDYR